MKKTITNLQLHKSRISGAPQCDELKILSHCSAPTAKKSKIFSLCPSIAVIYATLSIISISISNPVSALTYSDNVGVNFTFGSSLTVSLSSPGIIINDLTPGTSSDSNVIDVNVISNNLSGYSLNATVGNDSTYNNTNLTSINGNTFTSLTPSDSIVDISSFNDNQWGYSYSDQTVSTPTWSDYNGLPLYSDTTNIATLKTSASPSLSTGDIIEFKIAAKASPTQASGEYNNVINFTVVGNTNPTSFYDAFKEAATQSGSTITQLNGYYKMQDMSTNICNNVYTSQLADNTDTMEAQLIDIRDNNIYWVAKLKDGHCWMTQNLDLNLDKDTVYTYYDTDLGRNWDGAIDVTATWQPERSTIDAVTGEDTVLDSVPGWANSRTRPYSADTGDWFLNGTFYSSGLCQDGGNYDLCNYMRKTYPNYSEIFSLSPYATNVAHGEVGNYYNWTAAVASNDTASYQDDTGTSATVGNRPFASICPASWRLLTMTADYNSAELGENDFENLNLVYAGSTGSMSEGMILAPLYFARTGRISEGSLIVAGFDGYSWSSSLHSGSDAYSLYFTSSLSAPNNYGDRATGRPVRCLAR